MPGTRNFFIGYCVVSLILLGIAISGALQSRDVPANVTVGASVWHEGGCEGCHTIAGIGGSFAPDLTHIYSQRGDTYIREFIANPSAFHPNQRIMPRFLLTVEETNNLLAYLQYVDQQTPNWPPKPILVSGGGSLGSITAASADETPSDDPVVRGRQIFSRAPANCATCHALEPDVVNVGPSLAGIATRAATRVDGQSAEAYIRNSMVNPSEYVVDGFADVMAKNLGDVLSSQQINDLIAFLMTLE